MDEARITSFGLLIAYILPGFTALCGLGTISVTVSSWLRSVPGNCPTVGGFLYVTLTSIGLGMTVNAIRWLTLDSFHHLTGVRYPEWDFSQLQTNLGGYDKLVEFYYRYHEFFGNTLIAGSFTYLTWRFLHPSWQYVLADAVYLAFTALFWLASRDTLTKYYRRVEQLMPKAADKRRDTA